MTDSGDSTSGLPRNGVVRGIARNDNSKARPTFIQLRGAIKNLLRDDDLKQLFMLIKQFYLAAVVVDEARAVLAAFNDAVESIEYDTNIAKVSVVGVGMKSHSGVASAAFQALAESNINIMMISTSEIKISVVINAKYAELAVRSLHEAYKLDK